MVIPSKPLFFSQRLLPENSEDQPEQYRKRQKRKARAKASDSDQELLVFGYEAHIFSDKEMAEKVEDGKYLIPWQGNTENPTLLDRYDVRNLLDDLQSLKFNGHGVTNHSQEDHENLDVERYADLDSDEGELFLMSDEDERDQFVEEKRKRRKMELEQKNFQYAYDIEPAAISSNGNQEETKKQEEPAEVVRCNFQIPDNMEKPKTQKQLDIIEKTAKFIASSSTEAAQMEITIQAKQASNPMFTFLHRDNALYKFYRHILWLSNSGLSGYGSSDSDSEDDEAKTVATENASGEVGTNERQTSNSSEQENKDIYDIIEKTAAFVAKAGSSLESKIKEKNLGIQTRVNTIASQQPSFSLSQSNPLPPQPTGLTADPASLPTCASTTLNSHEQKQQIQNERLARVKAMLAAKAKQV
ncbi:unnamed protein product [Umbelopsis vinacea]